MTVWRIMFLIFLAIAGCSSSESIPLKAGLVQESLVSGDKVVLAHFKANEFDFPDYLLASNRESLKSSCRGSGKGCLVSAVIGTPIIFSEAASKWNSVRRFADGLLLRDPAALLQDHFASTLKQRVQPKALHVIPYSVETEYTSLSIDQGLIFIFRTTEWGLNAGDEGYAKVATSFSRGNDNIDSVNLHFLYKVDVALVSEPTGETLWRDSCSFDSSKNQSRTFRFADFIANDGLEIKKAGVQASEHCGTQLIANFLVGLPVAAPLHQ